MLHDQAVHPIPGSLAGWQTVHETHNDMRRSIFCVCPPGIAQQTLRVWRSLMSGCIPVTFFSAHDNPYERFSHLDYSKFSINVNPSETHLLRPMLTGLLDNPSKIVEMQSEVRRVQRYFIWDIKKNAGVFDMILTELQQHPARSVVHGTPSLHT